MVQCQLLFTNFAVVEARISVSPRHGSPRQSEVSDSNFQDQDDDVESGLLTPADGGGGDGGGSREPHEIFADYSGSGSGSGPSAGLFSLVNRRRNSRSGVGSGSSSGSRGDNTHDNSSDDEERVRSTPSTPVITTQSDEENSQSRDFRYKEMSTFLRLKRIFNVIDAFALCYRSVLPVPVWVCYFAHGPGTDFIPLAYMCFKWLNLIQYARFAVQMIHSVVNGKTVSV
jgi:hypothetical protein